MIKRRLAVLLAIPFGAGALSACGGDDTSVTAPGVDSGATDGTVTDGSGSDGGHDGSTSDAVSDGNLTDSTPVDAAIEAGPDVTGECVVPVVPGLKVVPVFDNFTIDAAYFAIQPPGSDDWYVVSQNGTITIVRAGQKLATPFLDISSQMGTAPGERGLLSLAFHPDYATNGRFFVMGTPSDNGDGVFSAPNADAIVEYKRSAANPDLADPVKVKDIVVLPASANNHNGGTIRFGADGFLYAATGDGGGQCNSNQPGAPQDTTKLFGKMLRLDIDGTAPYGAAGNPFPNDARVLHYGFRNPFRWNFDTLTGDIYVGHVGETSYESIDFIPSGSSALNFGWADYEGMTQGTCGGGHPLGGPSPWTPPIVTVDRTGGSSSPFKDYQAIVGGAVYRGTAIPALDGAFLFADYFGAEMGVVRQCGGATKGPVVVKWSDVDAPSPIGNITSMIQGHDGELYLTYGGGKLGKFALK